MNFLHNLNRWLRSTSGQLSAADWTSNINRMQVSHSVDDEASDRGVVLQRIWHLILLESVGGMRKKGWVCRWVGGWEAGWIYVVGIRDLTLLLGIWKSASFSQGFSFWTEHSLEIPVKKAESTKMSIFMCICFHCKSLKL